MDYDHHRKQTNKNYYEFIISLNSRTPYEFIRIRSVWNSLDACAAPWSHAATPHGAPRPSPQASPQRPWQAAGLTALEKPCMEPSAGT